jgi:hypothetical protein
MPRSLPLTLTPCKTRISTRYSLPQSEDPTSKSRKRKRGAAPDAPSSATEAPSTAGDGAKHGYLEVTANDTATGTCLWYRSSERSDVSRLLRSMVAFGGVMAGRRVAPSAESAWPAQGDGGAGEGGGEEAAEAKGKEKEKEDEGAKKKRKKKGKR